MKRNQVVAIGMAFSLVFNSMTVLATEESINDDIALTEESKQEELPIYFDSDIEVKPQIPEKLTISDMQLSTPDRTYNIGNTIELEECDPIDALLPYSVAYSRVQDYLLNTGDIKVLGISVNPGVYLQAQLFQPNQADIDYDLYILDANGTILAGSENYTYINGQTGTLPESTGYFTTGTEAAVYYLAARSSNGGSTEEPFTIEFAISNEYDGMEPNENPASAVQISFSNPGIYTEGFTLSSPVDNDWFKFDVLDTTQYDHLMLSIGTSSSNTCRLEIYKNTLDSGFKMQYIGSSTSEYNLEVEAGAYYVRICNEKILEEYNESNIQTYKFAITPILKADRILIKKIVGNEGEDTYRPYPEGNLFRTQDFLVVHGYVAAYDKTTKEYYGVGNHLVTLTYYNKHWRENNTPLLAEKSMSNGTDEDGLFVVGLDLPMAFGANEHHAPLSIQYYDVNTFTITIEGYPSLIYTQSFVQLKYSDYTG